MIYGPHGLGKTTFGAGAPAPIFILTEDGLGRLEVDHFPLAASYDDVVGAISTLYSDDHTFGTVVIDSLDWLDNLIWQDINAKHDAKDLAYGKGAVIAADYWRAILEGLSALRDEKGMAIVLIAHAEIKRFDSPEVEPFERYQPKLQARSSALVQEWCDAVLFCNYKTIVKKEDVGFNREVNRGITTGERLLHANEKPAYLAKNRYSLPDSLPLSWESFATAIAN
ncbi:AAA domain containing protein [uncultured Caudovirales phage]|uniref:AAA domain containing protein n=1 Tax=uncultured Caudovirales phage TaxID=2100421 RepID=A0A6J5MDV0_9CAUD|nr:AAA domain containing protein [uncultured Caudovirales phage]